MTQEEKDRVKAEGKAVAKDKRFVQAIAERTGVYIHYEVGRSHGWSFLNRNPSLPSQV